ncbi:exonuclease domain-containing protein [Pseudaestuariivita rosea]|uniref:exonuclease domain-containing protein n=1 Tax=Pseudaestuariivita rosea TaxID=2763263 RepID=UPI001ABB9756
MANLGHLSSLPQGIFRFISVDVETAGRSIASICQIGLCAVDVSNDLHTYSTLVDPEEPFDAFNTELHGINSDMVSGSPTFPEIYETLFDVLQTHQLVQHSRYDEKAFTAACVCYGAPMVTSYWTDSVQIARKAWPELKGAGGHGLASLKDHLGIDFRHHDAGEDARAAAIVILRAEKTLGKPIRHLRAKQQLSLRFCESQNSSAGCASWITPS